MSKEDCQRCGGWIAPYYESIGYSGDFCNCPSPRFAAPFKTRSQLDAWRAEQKCAFERVCEEMTQAANAVPMRD